MRAHSRVGKRGNWGQGAWGWWAAVALVALALLMAGAEAKKKKKAPMTEEEKLTKMAENYQLLASASGLAEPYGAASSPVLNVNTESEFLRVVIRSPRAHTLVILLTVDSNCAVCGDVDRMFGQLASAYQQQVQAQDAHGDEMRAHPRIFFIRAPVGTMMDVAQKVGTCPACPCRGGHWHELQRFRERERERERAGDTTKSHERQNVLVRD